MNNRNSAFLSTNLRFKIAIAFLATMSGATARAATIDIGVISFDEIVPSNPPAVGVNGFTIYNFTDSNTSGDTLSALTFDNASVLLNGSTLVNLGNVTPGSVQPANLDFPATDSFSSAMFSANLSSAFLNVDGAEYEATSTNISADLLPSSGNTLQAGVDFAVIAIEATPVTTVVTPEPATSSYLAASFAGLGLLCALSYRSQSRNSTE